ncbi:MAG: aldehyde dehydrogenase family protein, partial [Planctomycetaceae bacterium]|nr:aldehyde dehydrogenase family protein [Planctomycetaceae bacterium]
YRQGCVAEGLSLVLGAGNVSSIAPTDAFSKLFHEGKVVLLKMNPVNEYLGPIFARAFAPLIDAGFLRIIYGGADVGAYAINHPAVDEVHITGSVYSHDTIVWGPPGEERERRKAQNDPLLKKAITSELGNVTPWIVVPGPYTDKELRFQAENLASSITNNASFNCIATKMIVTSKQWPGRQKFLNYLKEVLNNVPFRRAYYPGALDRYRKFAGPQAGECSGGACPWTMVPDVHPERDPLYFDEESFVSVFAETAIDAPSEAGFLERAVEFANRRLWGTLGAALMVHPTFRKSPAQEAVFQKALADLRYGTIGINHWPALSYALMSPPWGGYPGGTMHDPQSGIGWVHNSYMFDKAEKTVLEGPLTMWPKPLWFPSNRSGERVSWKVVELYHRPSLFKLPGLLLAALGG